MQTLAIEFDSIRRRNYDMLMQPHRKKKYPFAFLGNIKSDSLPFKIKSLDAHYFLMREIDDMLLMAMSLLIFHQLIMLMVKLILFRIMSNLLI